MRGPKGTRALAALAVFLLAAGPLRAQADFQPTDYVVTRDGVELFADVFQSRLAGQVLILSAELPSPVRLNLRDARAETVQFMKVDRRADGGVTVLPDAADRSLGSFRVSPDGKGVSFDLDGKTVELKEKPPLLGDQDLAGMRAYSQDYVRLAKAYLPSGPILDRLRSENREVRVEVYFGSWCPACQQWVPRIMRVADELSGSNIQVDFYGLPQGEGFDKDPKVQALKITGVPTAVVFIDDSEKGRISTNGWKIPELTLNGILVRN